MDKQRNFKPLFFAIGFGLFISFFINTLFAQANADAFNSAQQFFASFDSCRNTDNGKLWGEKLPKKMLFVDRSSYAFVSNHSIEPYNAVEKNGLYYGKYPTSKTIANTSVTINNNPWTMLMWPLPKTPDKALELMVHEAFHSLQPSLQFNNTSGIITHMEEKQARIFFRLEMNALYSALFKNSQEAILHALFFRKKRFEQYPEGEQQEIGLETHEGLAQYTGYKLAYTHANTLQKRIKEDIKEMVKKSSLARATAYTSGPLYGLLLDSSGASWESKSIPVFDAFGLTIEAFNIDPKSLNNLEYHNIKMLYDGEEIETTENLRWKKKQQQISEYKKTLIQKDPLILKLKDKNIGFNPNKVVPLGKAGTVYEYFVLKEYFGTLIAKNGALMSPNWNTVSVAKPETITDSTATGPGWVLTFRPNFTIEKNSAGNYQIITKE